MTDDISNPVDPAGSPAMPTRDATPASSAGDELPKLPVFVRDAAMTHVGDDPEVLRSIAEMFLEEGPKRLAKIGAAVQAGDAGGLESSAHSLKGSAAILGLERVRALSLALEELGESGSVAGAEARMEALSGALEDGMAALRRELKSPA
ncbi:MAG: Hpt domain-containing protein [Gemmatimonadetes bacterium]|nr:Hpt domain-containing protein [Gemmatimonadota bacterium]